jgi:hypothetical protein
MATFGALHRVRLGSRERALLLDAEGRAFESDSKITGGLAVRGHNLGRALPGRERDLIVREDERSARVAAVRAAKRLEDLGLVEYRNQLRGQRLVYIALTDLGAAVVEHFRDELTTGRRIRWPKED